MKGGVCGVVLFRSGWRISRDSAGTGWCGGELGLGGTREEDCNGEGY